MRGLQPLILRNFFRPIPAKSPAGLLNFESRIIEAMMNGLKLASRYVVILYFSNTFPETSPSLQDTPEMSAGRQCM